MMRFSTIAYVGALAVVGLAVIGTIDFKHAIWIGGALAGVGIIADYASGKDSTA